MLYGRRAEEHAGFGCCMAASSNPLHTCWLLVTMTLIPLKFAVLGVTGIIQVLQHSQCTKHELCDRLYVVLSAVCEGCAYPLTACSLAQYLVAAQV